MLMIANYVFPSLVVSKFGGTCMKNTVDTSKRELINAINIT